MTRTVDGDYLGLFDAVAATAATVTFVIIAILTFVDDVPFVALWLYGLSQVLYL